MSELTPTPDGWAEQAPIDCENCSLAWPFDGTPDRVLVGWSPDGGRHYICVGCGHVTGAPDTYQIGHAPDEGRVKRSPHPPER